MAKAPKAAAVQTTVVEAAMASSHAQQPLVSKLIEEAMSAAASKAYSAGETDPVEIRKQMMAARERVKQSLGKQNGR